MSKHYTILEYFDISTYCQIDKIKMQMMNGFGPKMKVNLRKNPTYKQNLFDRTGIELENGTQSGSFVINYFAM